jgi:hypothetical protein
MYLDPYTLLGKNYMYPEFRAITEGWGEIDYIDDERLQKANEDGRFSLFDEDAGLFLFFTDYKSFTQLYDYPTTGGNLILSRLSFLINYDQGFAPYTKKLPYGIQATDSYQQLQARFNEPVKLLKAGGFVEKAIWHYKDLQIIVSFLNGGNNIKIISFIPCLKTNYQTADDVNTAPRLAQLSSFFGSEWNNKNLLEPFAKLGLDFSFSEVKKYGEIDFKKSHGIELYFLTGDKFPVDIYTKLDPKKYYFSGFRVRSYLDFKSKQFAGELPWGIDWEASPAVVESFIKAKPTKSVLDELDGYQEWPTDKGLLHILYTLLEDRILRVSVYANGCY